MQNLKIKGDRIISNQEQINYKTKKILKIRRKNICCCHREIGVLNLL